MHVKTGPLLLISLSLGLQLASTPAVSAAESAAEGLLIDGSSTVYPLTREAV
ncbi:MAG TPA: ABC transporter substrate-binding protein, partial [Pseudomonas sp.]|nr:ABC transporter substrate-binding protein [Pseudomonas sp.]